MTRHIWRSCTRTRVYVVLGGTLTVTALGVARTDAQESGVEDVRAGTLVVGSIADVSPETDNQGSQSRNKPQVTAPSLTEARRVGNKGDLQASVAFAVVSLQRGAAQDKTWSGVYSASASLGKFLTDRVNVEVGARMQGEFGSQACGTLPCRKTSDATTGLRYYLTPDRPASAYVGVSYALQLTSRDALPKGDIGSVIFKVGAEVLVGNKTSFFIEGGGGSSLKDFGAGRVTVAGGTRLAF